MAKQGFVAAGIGVTLIPSLAITSIRPDIALALLHPDDIPPRQVCLATASGCTPTPAVNAFVALMRDQQSAD